MHTSRIYEYRNEYKGHRVHGTWSKGEQRSRNYRTYCVWSTISLIKFAIRWQQRPALWRGVNIKRARFNASGNARRARNANPLRIRDTRKLTGAEPIDRRNPTDFHLFPPFLFTSRCPTLDILFVILSLTETFLSFNKLVEYTAIKVIYYKVLFDRKQSSYSDEGLLEKILVLKVVEKFSL